MLSILSVLLAPCKDPETDHKNKIRPLRTKEWPEPPRKLRGCTFWARCRVNEGTDLRPRRVYLLTRQPAPTRKREATIWITIIPKKVGIKYELSHKRRGKCGFIQRSTSIRRIISRWFGFVKAPARLMKESCPIVGRCALRTNAVSDL
jgi:hypothetical protein